MKSRDSSKFTLFIVIRTFFFHFSFFNSIYNESKTFTTRCLFLSLLIFQLVHDPLHAWPCICAVRSRFYDLLFRISLIIRSQHPCFSRNYFRNLICSENYKPSRGSDLPLLCAYLKSNPTSNGRSVSTAV